jgi:hypothetical protein
MKPTQPDDKNLKLAEAVKKIAENLGVRPLDWKLYDLEIVIVFENGKKLKFDARPDANGKFIQLL